MGGDTGLADMTFGSMAGMVAKIFEHPFDLVKVRLQSQPTDRPLSFTGPFDCFSQTFKKEGVRGLYRGISAPIIGAAAENASLFMVYGKCQEAITHFKPTSPDGGVGGKLGIGELMLAGAGAGAVTSFVLTPIELIKCRMQVQMLTREGSLTSTPAPSSSTPPSTSTSTQSRPFSTSSILRQTPTPAATRMAPPMGPFALISDTLRRQGLKGLWLGQTGTLLRETGGSAAWFGAYETSTRFFIRTYNYKSKSELAAWQLMSSGALAGVSYNVILFPADSIKSNMQTFAELNPGVKQSSFVGTGKEIFRTRGLRGLYAGCGLTCLRSGPSSAMIFFLFQRLEQNFGYIFGLDGSEINGDRSEKVE